MASNVFLSPKRQSQFAFSPKQIFSTAPIKQARTAFGGNRERHTLQKLDELFDFIAVGSGGGSLCAALVMRNEGKRVLVLEKTDLVGGSSAKSGGVMWIPNNRFMAAAGIDDSYEKANTYLDSVVGDHADAPAATRERRQAFLRQAPEMLDFLVSQGMKLQRMPIWPDYYDERPGGSDLGRAVIAKMFNLNELGSWKEKLRPNKFQLPAPLYDVVLLPLFRVSWRSRYIMVKTGIRGVIAKLTGKHWTIAGGALMGRMLQAALRANVEIRINSGVKELILEEDNVVGVVTTKDGRDWRIGARLGVLLGAGGFAQNQAMRDTYMPNTSVEWTHTPPGDTGDMHVELMRIGAAMAQMDEMVGNQMTVMPAKGAVFVQSQLTKPHAFLVDQSGVRYMNEGGSYMLFCKNMLERHKTTPAIPSWMIMDSRFLRTYMFGDTMPGAKKPQDWFDQNYMRKADTIEALATACSMEPAKLKATTDRFNRFAHAGRDEDFHRGDRAYDRWLGDFTHRPSPTLGAVEDAPFYAAPVVPGDVGTFGGVVTDTNARVLREDGAIVKGLYATGVTAASVMGHAYPGAGSSLGPSFTWGYVAAKHAVNAGNREA
jgi:3-oxosteroid 1-dehydrogenase